MINMHYIRAAIQAATGEKLTFDRIRELLVEEGLITQAQADEDAQDFRGYTDFYPHDVAVREIDLDDTMGLPDED